MAPRPELRFGSATEMRLTLDAAARRAPTGQITHSPNSPPKFATIQSAPVQAAFTPLPTSERGAHERATSRADTSPRTERAPAPFTPATYGGHATPPVVTPAPVRPRRRSGGAWAIVFVPLVVGAAAVGIWVVTTQSAPSLPTPPPGVTAPAAVTVAPPPTATALPTAAPLAPSPQPPSPPATPRAVGSTRAPHPSALPSTPSPASAPSEVPYTPPPFTLPSGFGFPTSSDGGPTLIPFPIPSGFPDNAPERSSIPLPGASGARRAGASADACEVDLSPFNYAWTR